MLRHFPATGCAAPVSSRSSDASDAALLERVVAGDLHAFESLYRIYHPRLHRFLGLVTQRQAMVEEVVNDTLLVVWKRSHTYNGRSKVSTWIFAIAYRTALKALRAQDEPLQSPPDDEQVSGHPGPEQQLGAEQARVALLHALDALSPEQRCALVLTYFHDLPYAEIARIVECPVDTVKTRVFHGRRRLRAMLHETFGDAT